MPPVDWLPRWKPSLMMLHSPPLVSSPRRHRHCRDSEGDNTDDARSRERTDSSTAPIVEHRNRVGSGGDPPPTRALPNKRSVVVGAILGTIGLLSLVALSRARGSAAPPPSLPSPALPFQSNSKARRGNRSSVRNESGDQNISRKGDDVDLERRQQEQGQKLPWVRVDSAKAAHPAMYVPADGVVYCPIAKVACAEWRKTLRWMLGIPDWDTGPIHEQGKNGIPLVAGRKPRDVEVMMNDDSWLKFVVVRDPADRLLSGFLNKCVGSEWQNCPYLQFMPHRFEGMKARNAKTDAMFMRAVYHEPREVFLDFVLGVRKDVSKTGCGVNSHWRPQHCFCSIALFKNAYHVIPFTNMSAEAVKLVDHMQRPSPARATLLREFIERRFSSNKDAKAQGAATKRKRFFSQEALDAIKQVYQKDYALFGEHFEEHASTPL